MADCGCEFEAKNQAQRRVLAILLGVNAAMFGVGSVAGIIAGSTALVADSLDNFADAAVFGISLYAIGRSPRQKVQAAFLSGLFQAMLASLALVNVVQRVLVGSAPLSSWMIAIAALSLIMNLFCIALMSKHRHAEVHMRASWIFLNNDVIANAGVILAGILVSVFNSRIPDLAIGLIIAVLVMRGAIQIIRDAKRERSILSKSV